MIDLERKDYDEDFQCYFYGSKLVSIKAATDIKTNSIKGGTLAINSTSGSITLLDNAEIETSSARGATASINIKSGDKIKLGKVRSNLNFDNGNGGNIKIEAVNQVSLNSSIISRSSQAFNSGNVKVVSQKAGIDFTWTEDNNPGISARSEAGMAGNITVEASGDITKNALDGEIRTWSENGGKAGNVKIASTNGKVMLGKTPVRAWADINDAGNVKIEASGDLEMGTIEAYSKGTGKGGDVSFISVEGDLSVGWIKSDSTLGEGGNVKLKSFKELVVDNGKWIDGIDYSIFALGRTSGGSIDIVYGGNDSLLFFDTSTNGFKGAISNDVNQIILSTSIIPASFTLDNSVVDSEGNNIVKGALGDETLVAGLPREGVNGNWQDPLNRANGNWIPNPNSEAARILRSFNRSFIEFRNGFPVFEPFKQGEVSLPQLGKTTTIDKNLADKLYAEQQGWLKPDGKPDIARVQSLRSTNGLTWHHLENSTKLQLVPTKINEIPHTGGRSTGGGGSGTIGGGGGGGGGGGSFRVKINPASKIQP